MGYGEFRLELIWCLEGLHLIFVIVGCTVYITVLQTKMQLIALNQDLCRQRASQPSDDFEKHTCGHSSSIFLGILWYQI